MILVRSTLAVVTFALSLGLAAPSRGLPVELMADGNVGAFRIFLVLNTRTALAGPAGMTLYTYSKDPLEKATCGGACAVQWPPMLAASGERGFVRSPCSFVRTVSISGPSKESRCTAASRTPNLGRRTDTGSTTFGPSFRLRDTRCDPDARSPLWDNHSSWR